jgi:hypothetical protein
MTTLETTYISSSESIDTILLDNETIVYVHYKDGYISIIETLQSLLAIMDGDLNNARWMWLGLHDDLDSVLRELSEKRM